MMSQPVHDIITLATSNYTLLHKTKVCVNLCRDTDSFFSPHVTVVDTCMPWQPVPNSQLIFTPY